MTGSVIQSHWDDVYTRKPETGLSWHQAVPEPSLSILVQAGVTAASAIVDIGGGASRLADYLVSHGYRDLTVLDLSAAALAASKSRLGAIADRVTWIAADVTTWTPPADAFDFWHDRAAFHFLTEQSARAAYLSRLRQALRPGGQAIFGTFALDGPDLCSGLPVVRYNAETLGAELGSAFALTESRRHEHTTPWGSVQKFQFSTFRFNP